MTQFKEEAEVAKMTSHKSNSEIINLVDKMVLVSTLKRGKKPTEAIHKPPPPDTL